ncbi:MAG TPA: ABC transporter permease [Kofleriaceae bacterium]|nr:ABC transporter permease [Kofleriaceae bacterium]
MWSSFVAVLVKEFKHIFRDRGTLIIFFTLPVMQLALFGFLDQNVRDLPTVVVDQDQSRESRELMDEMRATRTFQIASVTNSPERARAEIARGTVRVGVIIPPDYHDRRARHDNAQFLVLIDGSDSNVSAQALAAINGLVAQANLDALQATGARPQVSAQPIVLFNPEGSTANYIIPGLIAILLQLAAMLLASIAIVREREQGTMEQLLVTPINPTGLVLGKLAPYLVIGLIEMALILAIMRFGFGVPINGSLLFLFVTAVVYLFALLALGLTISMGAQTSMQAMQAAQMLLLPSIFLSGYIFPVAGLPRVLYWIGRSLPATHMIDIMRGAVLRSAGPWELLPSLLALAAISTVLVTISIRRVRRLTV